jgi:benzoyl-CoA-dihydrodiol lyase
MIDFRTNPKKYKHWQIAIEEKVAWLGLDVSELETAGDGYELKLNTYDIGVDIELNDAIQRLRFEHPSVSCVIIHSKKERVFCAGANIQMLGLATPELKINFCKYTNETRNNIENATNKSGQKYICAIKGPCAGGGYELALACDEIWLLDDGTSTVSLPEVPSLAVLPGTGGLTRLVDKRKVRRDRADFFCTTEEGIRGERALEWNLVDKIVPPSDFDRLLSARATEVVNEVLVTPPTPTGVILSDLERALEKTELVYEHVRVTFDKTLNTATFLIKGPDNEVPQTLHQLLEKGSKFWLLAMLRELEDAILHLRFNESELGTWVFKSVGDGSKIRQIDALIVQNQKNWLCREILLYAERVLKRLEVSARSIICLIEPSSCFDGTLFEIALAADQSFMLKDEFADKLNTATISLSETNFGNYRMVNGETRLRTRFIGDDGALQSLKNQMKQALDAVDAEKLGLVTFAPDDLDWGEEIRIALEARAGFSGDALTGMEANLRFPGPETMESKIFARLSVWQNWIFQRPNAVGDLGALTRYGSGLRPKLNKGRA